MQSAPSYTAVAARQTLQRPMEPTESPKKQVVTWTPAVREYVQRSFDRTNLRPGIGAVEMQEKLKTVITKITEAGQMDYVDWSTYPLPQDMIAQDREAAKQAAHANMTNNHSPMPSTADGSSPDSISRKRKTPDTEPDAQDSTTPPWRQKAAKNSLADRITGKSKKEEKKQKKANALQANGLDNNMDAVAKRRQRFGYVTPEPSPYDSSRDQSPDKPPTGPIIGTCQTLEKNYFRLTAQPPPNVVRPLEVLEKALDLVRQKWKTDHNYTYACDQLKSIRQDLTVQHIKNEFTVKVYEAHARVALEMADLGEYNQCQTQLRALYKLNLGGNPEEFTAYRILYIIYTCNRVDMNDVLADLTPADKQKPGVKHALKLRSALASGNYHMFFRLYDSAPYMGGYLLDMFVERERLAALATICKTYKQDVSLQFLATELAFHPTKDDPEAGLRQCLDFICQSGGEHLISRKDDDVRVAVAKAGLIFENLKATKFKRTRNLNSR